MPRLMRFDWLSLRGRARGHSAARERAPAPYSRRLRYEPLEHRRLLSITVDTLIDDNANDGHTTLREAIVAATPGDTIEFSVTGTIGLSSLGQLTIDKNLTISGPGANQLTIRAYDPTPDAGDGSRVFFIDDGNLIADKTVSISGLTLTGGDILENGGAILNFENLTVAGSRISGNAANGNGGAIYNSYGDLTVIGSNISGNTANYGSGGIHNYGGSLNVTGSTISGNATTYGSGGGIYSNYGGLTVTGSTISGNSTIDGDGGGIHSFESPLILTSSTISGNSTTNGFGGGILSDRSNVTLTSSTISGNSTTYGSGGGIYSYENNLTITNSTISGNHAGDDGGGIYKYYGNLTVNHSTITGNQADSDNDTNGTGGGIYTYDTGTEVLRNTILAGNTRGLATRDDAFGAITLRFSLIGDNTGATIVNQGGNLIGTDVLPIDPELGPLADNGGLTKTHALLAGSPAIDMGDGAAVAGVSGVPLHDQRGAPYTRVFNGDAVPGARIDMGALEQQPISPVAFGDYNKDGIVDAADYLVWRKTFGTGGFPAYTGADGDGDSTIDADDYGVWRTHFGQSLPPPGSGSGSAESFVALADSSSLAGLAEPASEQLGKVEAGSASAALAAAQLSSHAFSPRIGSSRPTNATSAFSDEQQDDGLLNWLSELHRVNSKQRDQLAASASTDETESDAFSTSPHDTAAVDDVFSSSVSTKHSAFALW